MARQISDDILANIGQKSEMVENNITSSNKDIKQKKLNSNQISIYVSKELKDELQMIAKELNITLSNLVKYIENSFYEKNIEYNVSINNKFSELKNLQKKGRKVGISMICDVKFFDNRAKERKFLKLSDYFDKAFEVILPDLYNTEKM